MKKKNFLNAKIFAIRINQFAKMLFEATFINKSGKWTDMNEIKFSLLEPKEDIFALHLLMKVLNL